MSAKQSLAAALGVIALAALIVVVGLLVGTRPLRLDALPGVLFAPDGKIDSVLVWTLRLPRSLAAWTAGAGLAVSGYLLQTLTRNPLAGPGLTGVTSGAVAPIVACFVFLPWLSSVYYPLIGMAGGLLAASVTFWIARGGGGRPLQLALGGVSVSLFLGAVTTYLIVRSGQQAPSLLFWLAGGLQGRSWPHLAYMAPWVAFGLVGTLASHRILGLLSLSEQAAAGMGVNMRFWKPALLILAVVPIAGIAPVAGPIGFVGLASPHIARLLRPAGTGWTIMLSASIGGLMLVAADVVARSIALPREVPVGVVTALLGGPVFIHLVQRRNVAFGGRA